MSDSIEVRQNRIDPDAQGYFLDAYNFSHQFVQIGLTIINEIDYQDLEFNQRLAAIFFDKISNLDKWWRNHQKNTGFDNIPLIRIFAVYFTRYLLTNIFIEEEELDERKYTDINIYRQIMITHVGRLFDSMPHKGIHEFFTILMRITARVLGFNDEIMAGKWNNYGEEIGILPRATIDSLSVYFNDANLLLVQIIMILTDDPKKMFDTFLDSYSIDRSMRTIYDKMIEEPEDYFHTSPDMRKDMVNLRHMMYMFNTLV